MTSPFLPRIDRQPAGWSCRSRCSTHDSHAGTITYEDPHTREAVTTKVTGDPASCNGSPAGHALVCARG